MNAPTTLKEKRPVHLTSWAQQPDIQIACDHSYVRPQWEYIAQVEREESVRGIHETDDGRRYTFDAALATCPACVGLVEHTKELGRERARVHALESIEEAARALRDGYSESGNNEIVLDRRIGDLDAALCGFDSDSNTLAAERDAHEEEANQLRAKVGERDAEIARLKSELEEARRSSRKIGYPPPATADLSRRKP